MGTTETGVEVVKTPLVGPVAMPDCVVKVTGVRPNVLETKPIGPDNDVPFCELTTTKRPFFVTPFDPAGLESLLVGGDMGFAELGDTGSFNLGGGADDFKLCLASGSFASTKEDTSGMVLPLFRCRITGLDAIETVFEPAELVCVLGMNEAAVAIDCSDGPLSNGIGSMAPTSDGYGPVEPTILGDGSALPTIDNGKTFVAKMPESVDSIVMIGASFEVSLEQDLISGDAGCRLSASL